MQNIWVLPATLSSAAHIWLLCEIAVWWEGPSDTDHTHRSHTPFTAGIDVDFHKEQRFVWFISFSIDLSVRVKMCVSCVIPPSQRLHVYTIRVLPLCHPHGEQRPRWAFWGALVTLLPLDEPFVGAAVWLRNGEEEGIMEQMPPCWGTKEASVTLFLPAPLCSPLAFIGRASKLHSAYEKNSSLYTTQISLSPPLPNLFHQNPHHPSHLCHFHEGRPWSAGSPISASSPFCVSSWSKRRWGGSQREVITSSPAWKSFHGLISTFI